MPRLIRRAPLKERIKLYLDPYDLLLRLAEELNDDTYDEWLNEWATAIALGLNLLYIVALGASRPYSAAARDDVFGDSDGKNGSGWFAWLAMLLVQALTLLCCVNSLYTFTRKRHYRLFEHAVDVTPATPSAHRVRVDSSLAISSPFRYLQTVFAPSTASSRAHPDPERDVWELRVWDPKPFNLKLFTLFSPGHVLLYYSLLPPAALDPRPSVTVLTAIAFGALLSLQLVFLSNSFTQQAKDKALLQGEVMHEYDTKFVHPSLNHPVRDVGTQTRNDRRVSNPSRVREVDVYTPTTILKRAFQTHPNTNYASLYDSDNLSANRQASRRKSTSYDNAATPSFATPSFGYANAQTQSSLAPSSAGGPELSSPLKQHQDRIEHLKPKGVSRGSSGAYSPALNPLRKSTGTSHTDASHNRFDSSNGSLAGRMRADQARSSSSTYDARRQRTSGRF